MSACETDFPSAPVPWRWRDDGPTNAHLNMETDEALLEAQKDPAALPTLRVFRWSVRTLSFGRLQDRHQAANDTMILGARAMVRRPTGGGTVIHGKDLSFSLSWRRDHPAFPSCLKNIYRGIHETVRRGLETLEVVTTLHKPAGKALPGKMCYDAPSEDDLMWNGKKVLGGALRVTGWGRLYQGNLLWTEMNVGDAAVAAVIRSSFENNFFKFPPET